jgi:hypothetical protein
MFSQIEKVAASSPVAEIAMDPSPENIFGSPVQQTRVCTEVGLSPLAPIRKHGQHSNIFIADHRNDGAFPMI